MELVNVYKTSRGVFNTEADAMKNRAWDNDRFGKTEKENVDVLPALKVGDRYFSAGRNLANVINTNIV